jgi:hypothetical protein
VVDRWHRTLVDRRGTATVIDYKKQRFEAVAAQSYVEKEHPRGKTVLSIWDGELLLGITPSPHPTLASNEQLALILAIP